MMMYLALTSHGHDRASVKRSFKDKTYTIVARKVARGVYDLFTLVDQPLRPDQVEFVISDTDEISE